MTKYAWGCQGLVVAALLAAGPAAASVPKQGVLVPGRSVGGVGLGARPAQVRAAWGTRFGVCRSCREHTWYFNYRPFAPQGVGVAFRNGRAVAVFTHWAPPGWRTTKGLRIGETVARVTLLYGALTRTVCDRYYALTMPSRRAVTSFYVFDDRVWGFGLSRPGVPVCR